MLELNKVMVLGNLTRDPESGAFQNGGTLAKFVIAINKSWKNKAGEWQKEVSFINVTAFGPVADFAAKWLKKGTRVFIEGELKQTTWETKDGTKRSEVGIQATSIRFADEKNAGDSNPALQHQNDSATQVNTTPPNQDGNDIPF